MSDTVYDNVELNELINDLKNVGNKNYPYHGDTKVTFQYSNSALKRRTKPDGSNFYNNEIRVPVVQNKNENVKFAETPKIFETANAKNTSQIDLDRIEVSNLQKELSMVKNELAILKRSQSLAGHPIFGESHVENKTLDTKFQETTRESSKQIRRFPDATDNNPKPVNSSQTLRNNFSSTTNVSHVSPNINKFQYHSLTRLNTPSTYSAHRENADRLRQISHTYNPKKVSSNHCEKYVEETEDCTLQPIGKGVQTLSGSLSNVVKSESYYSDKSHEESTSPKASYFDIMKSVKLTKNSWLRLDSSKEECQLLLSNADSGSFIIRIQSEYKMQPNGGMMFELILKISDQPVYNNYFDDSFEYFSLKEFIESVVKGFKLIGHAVEPIFPTLESFVIQHLEIPLGLPCCLKLPKTSNIEINYRTNKYFTRPKLSLPFNIISKKLSGSLTSLSSISSMRSPVIVSTYAQPDQAVMNVQLLFLGKVTVDRLNGLNAIRHAVDKVLINGCQPKHCIDVNVYFDSLAGISIVDIERILFFKKLLSPGCIINCDVDPLHRGLNSEFLAAKGIKNAKIFGVLYQKRKILIKENKVIVFAEFNPNSPMEEILKFVKNKLINQNIFN